MENMQPICFLTGLEIKEAQAVIIFVVSPVTGFNLSSTHEDIFKILDSVIRIEKSFCNHPEEWSNFDKSIFFFCLKYPWDVVVKMNMGKSLYGEYLASSAERCNRENHLFHEEFCSVLMFDFSIKTVDPQNKKKLFSRMTRELRKYT